MSVRHTADTITDDALDALYEQLDARDAALATYTAQLQRDQAALDRVRAAADKLANGTETGFRAALTIREALADPCKQHPNAPTIAGMCGGCTQYPTDKPTTA